MFVHKKNETLTSLEIRDELDSDLDPNPDPGPRKIFRIQIRQNDADPSDP